MKNAINKKYNDLYANSFEFRLFVEKMEKYSNEEIKAKYGLKINALFYPVDPYKRQPSK